MAKPNKIKHYGSIYQKKGGSRHPLTVIFGAIVVAGLVAVGYFIYEPLYNAIMDFGKEEPGALVPDSNSAEEQSKADPSIPIAEEEPTPEEPVKRQPIHARVLPAVTAADPQALTQFLDEAAGSFNAVMVDLKDDTGNILYQSSLEQVQRWGTQAEQAYSLSDLVSECAKRDIRIVGRLYSFKDHLMPRVNNETALIYKGSSYLWLDDTLERGGRPWINPYSTAGREYLLAIQGEAVSMGVDVIILDGVQFPYNAVIYHDAEYGQTDGKTAAQILSEFVREMTETGQRQGADIYLYASSLDVIGAGNPVFGGDILDISAGYLALGYFPSGFEAGYAVDNLVISAAEPDMAVKAVVGKAWDRVREKSGGADYLILLEDSRSEAVNNSRIKALEDMGGTDYVLY